MGKTPLKQRATNFCWMSCSLMASVDVIEFQKIEPYLSLELTGVKYSRHRRSRDKIEFEITEKLLCRYLEGSEENCRGKIFQIRN
jgi:hypothetical protein